MESLVFRFQQEKTLSAQTVSQTLLVATVEFARMFVLGRTRFEWVKGSITDFLWWHFMLSNFLFVAIGGSIGAMLRYGISLGSSSIWVGAFPWGTMVANLTGCLAMGVLMGLGIQKEFETHYLLIGVGVLGALTTYSTFSAETLQLAMDGQWAIMSFNVVGNLAGSLGACFLGLFFCRLASGS